MKALSLPKNSFIVFGSCPMALAGLRESSDIDLLVTPELRTNLKERGWVEINKGKDDHPLSSGIFEAHDNWSFSSYSPTLKHLLSSATITEGIPFASLHEVRKWKAASGRPKDATDIELIDNYLSKNSV